MRRPSIAARSEPIATSAPGVRLCEHLPHLAKQAHHLAIVRSLGDHGRGTGDHHAGYYYNLTGHAPDRTLPPTAQRPHAVPDRLAVDRLGRRARNGRRTRTCRQLITLPHKAGRPGVHPARPVRRPARPRVRPGLRGRHARQAAGFRRARR